MVRMVKPTFLVLCAPIMVQANVADLPMAVVNQARRYLNLGGLFGSATHSLTPYERVAGHPVFQVTTPWGGSYMTMEKLTDNVDQTPVKPGSLAEDQNQYRTVSVYYMDPEDALFAHGNLAQMAQLKDADIRITAGSLAKALRQSSNLDSGLLTGAPVDTLTGKVPDEGGTLRYKIMPPKRQLYYAARCIGKERVGLFGDDVQEDANAAAMGNDALEGLAMSRRLGKESTTGGTPKARTAMKAQNAHMEGYLGIPVFFCPSLTRKQPKIKQFVSGCGAEKPFFFNYEDLVESWGKLKKRNPKQNLPDTPPAVEVFNLWDVLTSMEKEQWKQKKAPRDWMKPIRKRIKSEPAGGLESITFIPPSRCIDYKEKISAQGNGKARLRPMR